MISPFRHSPRRVIRTERGAVIPATALLLTVLLTMTAFAIDLGRLRTERRDLQADADAIALDAVQVIAGLGADAALAAALDEANDSADRNNWPDPITDAELAVGTWDVNRTPQFQTETGTARVFAVQVTLHSSIPMYFDLSAEERSVTRTSVAVSLPKAGAEIGSVFTGIQAYDSTAGCAARATADAQMTFMNHLYTEYFSISSSGGVGAAADTGTVSCDVTGPADGLQFDALSWQGLAFADVSLKDIATQMGAASPDELFNSTVGAGDLLEAAAVVMQASGDPSTVAAGNDMSALAASVDGSSQISMVDIVSGSVGNNGSAGDMTVNALNLISVAAMAINGEDFVNVELPTNIPIAGPATVRIGIIQKPQLDPGLRVTGQSGPKTAQVKIGIELPISGAALDFGLLGTQSSDGVLSTVVEVARASSTHTDISCVRDDDSVTDALEVETGAVTVSVGSVSDAELQQGGDATITQSSVLSGTVNISVPLVGSVSLNLGASTQVDETITYAAEGAFNGGHDTNVNLLGSTETYLFQANGTEPWFPTPLHRYDGGVSGTAIGDATYSSLGFSADTSVLSLLGITSATFDDIVSDAISPATGELDSLLIDPLLSALGITVAGADARITAVHCQGAALANRP